MNSRLIARLIAATAVMPLAGADRSSAWAAEPAASQEPGGAMIAPLAVIALPAPAPQAVESESDHRRPPVEEIVVTAQRREESLQDVPISITVFSQEQISKANVVNAADLATYTPSLTTNNRFGNENASFAIRGFTQDLRTTASVAVYFADVVAPRGQSLQTSGDGAGPGSFFDLQNVQVLKGPQGTVFGRNTTGGAVLIVPRKPEENFGGYVEATGGDYEARRIQGAVNIPVNDRFRLRLGLDRNTRDGYVNNITRIGTSELNDVDYTALRLSAVFDLTDDIENYTILTYVKSDTYGSTAQLFDCNPGVTPLNLLIGTGCQDQLDAQAAAGQNGFYDVVSTLATPVTEIKEKRLINTTTWQLNDEIRFKNILAYAHLHTLNSSEVFGSQFHALYDPDPNRYIKIGLTVLNPDYPVTSQQTFVEEMQLQGTSFDGDLDWQLGAYYEHSRPDGVSGNNSATLLSCNPASIEKSPAEYDCVDALAGLVASVRNFRFKTDYLNRALYTQASYSIIDELSLTAGLRYTNDRTKGESQTLRYGYLGPVQQPVRVIETSPSVNSEAITGLVNIDYKPFERTMLYAKYARGYRQGSINMAADPGLDTFEPEQVDTYEVGTKLTFGGLVPGRFNTAVFYNDFRDMQLQTGYVSPNVGSTTAIFNAGKARIAGAEVEMFLQLLDLLSLSVSASWLDTKLIKQQDHTTEILLAGGALGALTAVPITDVGDTLPFAPDQTYVTTLGYTLPTPDRWGDVDLSATYVYIGEQRATATSASPNAILDHYSLLNLNLLWAGLFGSQLDLAVFATNVLDKQYTTYVSGTYNNLGFDSRNGGLPRMLGARLRYSF